MEKQKTEYNFVKASAKEAPFSNDGSSIRVSILIDDLVRLAEEHPELHQKGYVNIELKKKKSPDQYGNTHMVIESTFRPKEKGGTQIPTVSTPATKAPAKPITSKPVIESLAEESTDDLPF